MGLNRSSNLTPDPSPSERGALSTKVCSPSLKEKGLGDEVVNR